MNTKGQFPNNLRVIRKRLGLRQVDVSEGVMARAEAMNEVLRTNFRRFMFFMMPAQAQISAGRHNRARR